MKVKHKGESVWAAQGSPFTFVVDGVASAIEKAQKAAGRQNVLVGGSQIVQQSLNAGLLDEIHIDLVPILLGAGIRLFDHLQTQPIGLENTKVLVASGVTHLRYRVVK